jgi:hypothetical protein
MSERKKTRGRPEAEVWIVDRVDGKIAVLIAAEDLEDEEEAAVVEVAARLLGDRAVEGAVLRVPIGAVGEPMWDAAERDEDAEEARRAEGEAALERLRRRDPGGDVVL